MSIPSYYFTLFKKFQVLGHVPNATQHGANAGAFNLNDPKAVFGKSDTGALLSTSTVPSDNPLWAILNSRAMGNSGFTPVNVDGIFWPTMPVGSGSSPPAWSEFQVSAPVPALVQVFADWIVAGKVKDIPDGVIAQMPLPIKRLEGGVTPFVCSLPADDGIAPLPTNFWATSLIFLVNPNNGVITDPHQFSAGEEYYLTAIIGNRGRSAGGRYANTPASKLESQAWVMVWNSGMGPAVQLPALSNLDLTSKQGNYETYFLNAGCYDVIGFRLNVQTVFDGLVKAIEESDVDLGGLTPEQWVHTKDAHLCVKIRARHEGQPWPSLADTPFTNRRIAQKNLARFNIDLSVKEPDPRIVWKNFMIGDTIALTRFDNRLGSHKLKLQSRLPRNAFRIYLAMPRSVFTRLTRYEAIRGFEIVNDWPEKFPYPFPDAAILCYLGRGNAVIIPPIGESSYIAMSLGIEYHVDKLKPNIMGEVSIMQTATTPKLDPMSNSYEIVQSMIGGFTIVVEALPA